MNSSSLIPKLRQSFSNCALVSPDVDMVRCERIYQNRPRSVYFFQSAPALPGDAELVRIHEDVVSPSYFQARDSSRWNHYVVFVADDASKSSAEFRRRLSKIEADTNYARKLVVFQSDLDAFVDHSLTRTEPDAPVDAVVNIWTKALQAAGLAQIQRDTPRAPLVRNIRAGTIKPETAAIATKTAAARPAAVEFIKTFQIKRFNDRKISGTFALGRVNLFRGPNGSGKTSLFEAIEHFLCGATYRSGGRSEELDAIATFTSGRPVAFATRSNAWYQERDLHWYGRTVNRGNRLYEGFARFNFLNTDAAVHFADQSDLPSLKNALSMVALGPDAAHTWNRMGEFEEDISKDLTLLNNSLSERASTLDSATSRLAALQTVSPQVEAQRSIVSDALQQLGWKEMPANKEDDADWFKELSPLRDFVEASKAAGGHPSAVAVHNAMVQMANDLKWLTELDSRARKNAKRQDEIHRRRVAQDRIEGKLRRLEKYLRSGFPALCENESRCEKLSAEIAQRLIAPSDLEELREVVTEAGGLDRTLGVVEDTLRQNITTERQQLAETDRQRTEIQQRLRDTEALIAEIHRLGHQFADAAPEASKCPLCHTAMSMMELLQRLDQATDRSTEGIELSMLSQVAADARVKISRWTAAQLTLTRLISLTSDGRRTMMQSAIDLSRRDSVALEQLEAQLNQLRPKLAALRDAGFDDEDYTNLIAQLQSEPYLEQRLGHLDLKLVERFIQETNAAEVSLIKEEESLRKQVESIATSRSALRHQYGTDGDDADEPRNTMQSQLDKLAQLSSCIRALPAPVQHSRADDLRRLTVDAAKALKVVDDLNAQIQNERARNKEIGILQTQISRDREEQKSWKAESKNLTAALKVLRDLRRNHSLDAALSNFLASNLSAIQDIFSKIHVPHELRLSSLADFRMERIGSDQTVALTQISTGQRAALVLSVFFALNLSLRQGPPQILIDDPVAHIDDLNALSFLDFLADVAESGKRQIFFATANEKLANLLHKKMEFLGSDFKSYEMPEGRRILPPASDGLESA